jgi:hypothetical protein
MFDHPKRTAPDSQDPPSRLGEYAYSRRSSDCPRRESPPGPRWRGVRPERVQSMGILAPIARTALSNKANSRSFRSAVGGPVPSNKANPRAATMSNEPNLGGVDEPTLTWARTKTRTSRDKQSQFPEAPMLANSFPKRRLWQRCGLCVLESKANWLHEGLGVDLDCVGPGRPAIIPPLKTN